MILGKRIKKGLKWGIVLIAVVFIYKYNPYQIEFLGHYDKIWAHRVNTLEKLSLSKPFFNGVELDLVYTNGVLDITHPPAASIGLTLEAYLASLNPADSLGLWLDIKNLEQPNAQQIYNRLTLLLKETNYPKSKLLIETRYPEALSMFLEDGFRGSYYLPAGMHSMSKDELSQSIKGIATVLEAYPKLEISCHFKDYPIMASRFKATKNIWITNHSRIKDYRTIRELLKDQSVKTVLIRYKSISGMR